jgi:hypothetical protein
MNDDNPLKLTNNSDIAAAIPALLGFLPTASFIVILLDDIDGEHIVRCLLRGDLDADTEAIAALPANSGPAFHGVDAVILVATCPETLDHKARTTLDALRTGIEGVNVAVRARLITRDLSQHGHWVDIDTGHTGPVYPYTDALLSAEVVHRGHAIAKTREQIVAEFTCTTNPVPVIADDPGDILMTTLEEIAAAAAANTPPTASLATRAGILITDNVHLRDTMLLLGAEQPRPAAALWTTIANQLNGAPRIQALTIAAANYYMSSDAVRTGIALEIAEEDAAAADVPYPSLAVLLSTALQAGLSPADIRAAMQRLLGRDS